MSDATFAIEVFDHAVALHRAGKLDSAEAIYKKTLAADPTNPQAMTLLGTLYIQQGNVVDGLLLISKAIAAKPDHAEAHYNKGLAVQMLGRYEEAVLDYTRAITIDPRYDEAIWHKSLLLLTLGQYEEGWKLYETRWNNRPQHEVRVFREPLWLGKGNLNGKTILLYAEQGLGDTIQFCRYAPLVEALGARIILEVPESLAGLISTLESDFHLATQGGTLPAFDLHCPLMSLPLALNTSIETVPSSTPYLFCSATRRRQWQEKIGTKKKPRIGLACSGSASHPNDHNRTIAASLLTPLLEQDAEFHLLQTQPRPEETILPATYRNVISHAETIRDFADTAALIMEMDIVISVDTSVAHLAGALGKPVWILLPFVPDFRWLIQRTDSPWYPTARLFRQQKAGDWKNVIQDITIATRALFENLRTA